MSYFKAKLLCLPLVITMLFSIVTVGSLANYSLDAERNEDAFVSDNLAINAPIMNYLFVEDYSEQDAKNNSAEINNTVSWSLDKTVGWNSDDFDGQHSESKGMSVYSNYTFEGNVENPIYQVKITAGANIQYVYVVNMPGIGGGATIQCHTNSEPLATESYVDIIP